MDVSREGPAETDARLRRVVAEAALETFPGAWWFDELPLAAFPARVRPDAVALVRDRNCWSQLVPVRFGDAPAEQVRLWCFQFPAGLDNSGFVGWLATRIKRETEQRRNGGLRLQLGEGRHLRLLGLPRERRRCRAGG